MSPVQKYRRVLLIGFLAVLFLLGASLCSLPWWWPVHTSQLSWLKYERIRDGMTIEDINQLVQARPVLHLSDPGKGTSWAIWVERDGNSRITAMFTPAGKVFKKEYMPAPAMTLVDRVEVLLTKARLDWFLPGDEMASSTPAASSGP